MLKNKQNYIFYFWVQQGCTSLLHSYVSPFKMEIKDHVILNKK